jgi:protein-arginine kinase activator protein McsA
VIATCPHCSYVWRSDAGRERITCPNCGRKFPRPAVDIVVLGRGVPLKTTCDLCGYPKAELNVCRIDGESAFVCSVCLKGATAPPHPQE